MFHLPLFLTTLVQCSLLAYYQFWSDSGQNILDHSGNGHHAVNGCTTDVDSVDGVLTARGAYFSTQKYAAIPVNANTGVGIPLGNDFSVSAWVLPFSTYGRIYEKWTGLSSLWFFRIVSFTASLITLNVESLQNNAWISTDGTVGFANNQWMLLSVKVSCKSYCKVVGYKNYETVLSSVRSGSVYVDDKMMPSRMGAVAYDGFIYELKLYDHFITLSEIYSEYELPGYNGCPGDCSSLCVKSPYAICLPPCPYVASLACSAPCPCNSSMCKGDCRMAATSCSLAGCGSTVYFDVESHAFCDPSCMACSGPSRSQCLTCSDSNAVVSSGECVCKAGFYAAESGCAQCHSTCEKCDGGTEHDCVACKESAVLSSAKLCVCDRGSFPNPDSSSCQICDSLCEECTMSGPSGCTKCKASSYLAGDPPSRCVCAPGFFLDSGLCTQCHASCSTCSSSSDCLSCKTNALLSEGSCKCVEGYYGEASHCFPCAAKCFQCSESACLQCSDGLIAVGQTCADSCPFGFRLNDHLKLCEEVDVTPPVPTLSIAFDNTLQVSFDKPMNISLSLTDISVEVTDSASRVSPVAWTDPVIEDPQRIVISLIFESNWLPSNCTAQLTFLDLGKLVDEFRVPIEIAVLKGLLHAFGSTPTPSTTPALLQGESAKQAAATSKAGVSAGVATSFLNGSPSSLLTLINQLQLISYLAMTRIPLSAELAQTLAALNVGSMVPNPLSKYISVQATSQEAPKHIQDYGIESTLFVRNSGSLLGASGAILASILPIFLLSKSKIEVISDYFKAMLPSFKWGIPLRLWLTSYLDLGIFSLLQLRNLSNESAVVGFSTAFAFAAGILFALTPLCLMIFLCHYSALIQSNVDPAFSTRWGALFQDFTPSSKLAFLVYYPLFAIRRLTLAVTLIFTSDFILFSALLNTMFACVNFLFLLLYRPYNSKLDVAESIAVEGGTLLIYIAATTFAFDMRSSIQTMIGTLAVWVIRATIAMNVAMSLIRSGVSVVVMLKLYKERMKRVETKYKVREAEITTIVRVGSK